MQMQGNEFRIDRLPAAAAGSAAIHLHAGIALKPLSGLGKKKRLYRPVEARGLLRSFNSAA